MSANGMTAREARKIVSERNNIGEIVLGIDSVKRAEAKGFLSAIENFAPVVDACKKFDFKILHKYIRVLRTDSNRVEFDEDEFIEAKEELWEALESYRINVLGESE